MIIRRGNLDKIEKAFDEILERRREEEPFTEIKERNIKEEKDFASFILQVLMLIIV